MLLLVFAVLGHLDWMYWTVTLGGLVMAIGVLVSTGRLISRDRAAKRSAHIIVEADTRGEAAGG